MPRSIRHSSRSRSSRLRWPLTIMPETEQEGAPRDLFEDAQSAGVDAENLHLDEEPV